MQFIAIFLCVQVVLIVFHSYSKFSKERGVGTPLSPPPSHVPGAVHRGTRGTAVQGLISLVLQCWTLCPGSLEITLSNWSTPPPTPSGGVPLPRLTVSKLTLTESSLVVVPRLVINSEKGNYIM